MGGGERGNKGGGRERKGEGTGRRVLSRAN